MTEETKTPKHGQVSQEAKDHFDTAKHEFKKALDAVFVKEHRQAASWIMIAACIAQGILSYPSMVAQERSCMEKYGEAYREYMKTAPRYFMFF